MKDYYSLIEYLRVNVVNVVFDKADGSERSMRCTLKEEYLPQQLDLGDSPNGKEPNTSVAAVWDLDKSAWRSFRLDRLKSMTAVDV